MLNSLQLQLPTATEIGKTFILFLFVDQSYLLSQVDFLVVKIKGKSEPDFIVSRPEKVPRRRNWPSVFRFQRVKLRL
jgi:hypothetical protein